MRTSREAVRVTALMCLGCALLTAAAGAGPVDGARIINADAEPGNWHPPPEPADAASVARGEPLFDQYCSACHGEHAIGGGVVPDLRASNFLAMDFFPAIRNYLIHRANQDTQGTAASH